MSTPPPRVSIVLPVHNGANYLDLSIRSCVDQTWTDWELIVVDDGSTDATPGIVAAWTARDPRIRSVRNTRNMKLPASLNRGTALARGAFVTWTSDDNLYRPEALATMVRLIDEGVGADVVHAGCDFIDADGESLGPARTGPVENLASCNMVGACFLYRRAVHDRLRGYDEKLFLVEDYDFWLRAVGAGFRFRFHPGTLYDYRHHPLSLTSRRVAEVCALDRWLVTHRFHHLRAVCREDSIRRQLSALDEAIDMRDSRLTREAFAGILRTYRGDVAFLRSELLSRRRMLSVLLGPRLALRLLRNKPAARRPVVP